MKNLLIITVISLLSAPAIAGSNIVNFDVNDIARRGKITLHRDNSLSVVSPEVMTTLTCRKSGYRTLNLFGAGEYPEGKRFPLRRTTRFKTHLPLRLENTTNLRSTVIEACQRGMSGLYLNYTVVGQCIKVKRPSRGLRDNKLRTKPVITDLDCR